MAGRRPAGASLAWATAVLGIVLSAPQADGYAPNAPRCAWNIAAVIQQFVIAGAQLSYASVDCSPDSFSELDCGGELTASMYRLAYASADISDAFGNCGNRPELCSRDVSLAVRYTGELAQTLIAAAADCLQDPFICTVDVVDSVNNFSRTAMFIDNSLLDCNPPEIVPGNFIPGTQLIPGISALERRLDEGASPREKLLAAGERMTRLAKKLGATLPPRLARALAAADAAASAPAAPGNATAPAPSDNKSAAGPLVAGADAVGNRLPADAAGAAATPTAGEAPRAAAPPGLVFA